MSLATNIYPDMYAEVGRILMATGDSWRAQRNAGQTFITPPTLQHFTHSTLPHNLHVLLDPLDAAAKTTEIIDFDTLAMDYSLAVFGELAFDVSPHHTRNIFS